MDAVHLVAEDEAVDDAEPDPESAAAGEADGDDPDDGIDELDKLPDAEKSKLLAEMEIVRKVVSKVKFHY